MANFCSSGFFAHLTALQFFCLYKCVYIEFYSIEACFVNNCFNVVDLHHAMITSILPPGQVK